jgi:hypothetical protein
MPPAVTNMPLWMYMKTPHAAQSMATTRPEDKSFKKQEPAISPAGRKMTLRIGDLENCDAHLVRAECGASSGDHSCDITPSRRSRWPWPLATEAARPPASAPKPTPPVVTPDPVLPPAPTQASAPAPGQAQRHPARERPWRHWSYGSADPAERAPRGFDLDQFSFYSLIP